MLAGVQLFSPRCVLLRWLKICSSSRVNFLIDAFWCKENFENRDGDVAKSRLCEEKNRMVNILSHVYRIPDITVGDDCSGRCSPGQQDDGSNWVDS